ncbi:MAG: RNA 2',3'-cyclic phosphodiesterase [Euryarchaeota archaeon]|nr:RNA 2',3'-cyclic phosphodiesterase [Euryarchaeota archaeon]MDE1836443.1 RNA 2',3'-cyclic phosphodiesterase [Euryarchaeota archaeon]MDE1879042.1 RNA 2',3'-cyclic phosphodiesterase [Euryarchaeota archaeon]MDE2044191.1 RNA 2',3'-cyclic phosphodiesterase [Thermoplasmata archaeon]
MRLFVAVDTPAFHLPGLGPSSHDGSAPAHLTLKFLGEVPEERLGEIGHALERGLQGASAFPITLRGMGVFPSRSRPRVLWVGVSQGAKELSDLARRTEGALQGLGFAPEEHPFSPHVTVRRFRPGASTSSVPALLERHAETIFASGWVRSVELKASQLSSEGARHTTLLRVPLGSPPS